MISTHAWFTENLHDGISILGGYVASMMLKTFLWQTQIYIILSTLLMEPGPFQWSSRKYESNIILASVITSYPSISKATDSFLHLVNSHLKKVLVLGQVFNVSSRCNTL